MEPHKNTTEQDFRDKLGEREIMPSAAAWDRLDAMLAVAEEKKSKRGYGWLYIAASISGFLLIGTLFLSQTEEAIDQGRKPIVFEEQMQPAANPSEAIAPNTNSDAVASTEDPKINTNNTNHQSKFNQPSQNRELAQQSASNQNQSSQSTIINQNPVEAVTRAKGELAVGNEIPNQKLIASAQPEAQPNRSTRSEKINPKTDRLQAAAKHKGGDDHNCVGQPAHPIGYPGYPVADT